MSSPSHIPPPPTPSFLRLSYPAPRVVLVTMSRPEALNCINNAAALEMDAVWRWLDDEPTLSVAVLTGAGRAFCCGADLKEWLHSTRPGAAPEEKWGDVKVLPLSKRLGKKPIIAAVNGICMGGGTEFAVNCDMVIAAETATFGLPEVKRGLAPFAGALPRLIRTIGLQRASEFALTGRTVSAQEAEKWGLVNKIVPKEQVLEEAIKLATMVASNSPDAVIAARSMLRQGWETASVNEATEISAAGPWEVLLSSENMREGLAAFQEKRKPNWGPSKL